MEYTPTHEQYEKSEERQQEIAQEIFDAITTSLQYLRALPGVGPEHSNVIELQQELAVAKQSLQQFSTKNTTNRAA